MTSLLAALAVPPHIVGTPPLIRSRYERGVRELAYAEAFARQYGIPLVDVASDDALQIAYDRHLRYVGIID